MTRRLCEAVPRSLHVQVYSLFTELELRVAVYWHNCSFGPRRVEAWCMGEPLGQEGHAPATRRSVHASARAPCVCVHGERVLKDADRQTRAQNLRATPTRTNAALSYTKHDTVCRYEVALSDLFEPMD